jgi:hypothetical protein
MGGRVLLIAYKLGARMTRIDGDSLADFLTAKLSEPCKPPANPSVF